MGAAKVLPMELCKAWISLTGASAWCVGQVSLHNSKTEWVCEESVRLPKESTVADLLALLAQQLQVRLSSPPPPPFPLGAKGGCGVHAENLTREPSVG